MLQKFLLFFSKLGILLVLTHPFCPISWWVWVSGNSRCDLKASEILFLCVRNHTLSVFSTMVFIAISIFFAVIFWIIQASFIRFDIYSSHVQFQIIASKISWKVLLLLLLAPIRDIVRKFSPLFFFGIVKQVERKLKLLGFLLFFFSS